MQRRADNAARLGIDDTTSRAVNVAKPITPVDTATLQGSIMMRPAQKVGRKSTGFWGSFNVEYAIYQELGTVFMPGKFFLQRAMISEYPKLWQHIAARYKRG